jgi:hypothetical protein
MEDWELYKDYKGVFIKTKKFNGCIYAVIMDVQILRKSIKFWVSTISGKKRKDLEAWEHQTTKSLGGIQALIWIKRTMLEFPQHYRDRYTRKNEMDLPTHLCIEWTDSRRRDIYERLRSEGFHFTQMDGVKILIKNIKND